MDTTPSPVQGLAYNHAKAQSFLELDACPVRARNRASLNGQSLRFQKNIVPFDGYSVERLVDRNLSIVVNSMYSCLPALIFIGEE